MLEEALGRRQRCAARARAWLDQDALVLDTETTGIDSTDEVIAIAVVDGRGNTLLNTLVRPTRHIPEDATRLHGITDADVAGAPTGAQVCRQLGDILSGRLVCIYNASFDTRLLAQTARAWGARLPRFQAECVMRLFAEFEGEWNPRYQEYRWHRLSVAAERLGLDGHEAHDALSDALTTARILQSIAEWGSPTQPRAPRITRAAPIIGFDRAARRLRRS
ncbi:MAG: exonuclease domain-containing protein [Anaerolineae bacterium]|jgi:DNA polymerase-3 subunit epsilon